MLSHVINKRIQHFWLIVAGQAALFLSPAGIFKTQTINALDLLGQLLPAKREIAGINNAQVIQHTKSGAASAEVYYRNQMINTAFRHLMGEQLTSILKRKGFDVDDAGC